jgi:hypothetical protein
MSSVVVSTSAALGRPFLFDDHSEPEVCRPQAKKRIAKEPAVAELVQSVINNQKSGVVVTSASRLETRPAPEMASSGIAEIDGLTGGLPRGCLTEICGCTSSGRTSVLLAAVAVATRRGEFCALIDASDALNAQSVAATDADLDRFLWVRCGQHLPARYRGTEKTKYAKKGHRTSQNESEHRLEQVLRATDLLLESGGFGLIILDLADVPPEAARRIPLTTWFRFRRAVEHKPTILLVVEQQAIAGSCASLLLKLGGVFSTQYPVLSSAGYSAAGTQQSDTNPKPLHANLLSGLEIRAEVIRSRFERKPAKSIAFETTTAWTG